MAGAGQHRSRTGPVIPDAAVTHWAAGRPWPTRTQVEQDLLLSRLSTRELVATKIRALYERKKSRDVFDMWLAVTELGLGGEDLLAVFEPYHPKSLTAKTAEANLRARLSDDSFRHDLDPFVIDPPDGYDLDAAAEVLIDTVLSKIGKPPTS